MYITVVVCTHNRCQSLAATLTSLAASELPTSVEWEVLVVDNSSSDQTREVVARFCTRYGDRFRYAFEPRQGKSYALNTAIGESRSDILAFVDDDVTVEPAWLHNLTSPLENPQWAGAGGPIVPEWSGAPPAWLSVHQRSALNPLACFDLGGQARQLSEAPFGTNMAFRRDMFHKYGYFRTDLGPRPGSLIRGEDTEFGSRLLASGERLWYEPSAVVHHPVQEERLHKRYFLAWWHDKGRSDIRQFGIPARSRCIKGIPLVSFRRMVAWALRSLLATDPRSRFDCRLQVARFLGEIRECAARPPKEENT